MPARTATSKAAKAKKQAKQPTKRQARQTAQRTAKGKGKQVAHRELFKGPNLKLKLFVEIPIRASHPFAFSNDSSCITSTPLRKLGHQITPKHTETEMSAASPPMPVRPRRVILKLTSPSQTSPPRVPWRERSASSSASSVSEASTSTRPSRSISIETLPIDPDDLAQSLDQYDEAEDPQSFETLVIPPRSPNTEKKSYYVGNGYDPRQRSQLKRKRSDQSLSPPESPTSSCSSKRPKLIIRVPSRRPKVLDSEVPPQNGGGKELSKVLELAQISPSESAQDVFDSDLTSEDAAETIPKETAEVNETNELCSMCESWKKALGSPGRHEWLAQAGPGECEHCRAKDSKVSESSHVEAIHEEPEPESSLDLPPSLSRASIELEEVASPLEGPGAIDEALMLEETDSIITPERTPSLSSDSTRSSVSLGALDHPDIDLCDFELEYPETYSPSPLPTPHPLVVEIQAEVMRCLEFYQEQADAWFAAHEQAKINSELETNDKYAAEEVATLSNSFQLVGLTPTDAELDSNDSDVNMADWLSSSAVSTSASVEVQG